MLLNQEMSSATRTSVPNSEAVNRGYNFASTWEQVLFLTVLHYILCGIDIVTVVVDL